MSYNWLLVLFMKYRCFSLFCKLLFVSFVNNRYVLFMNKFFLFFMNEWLILFMNVSFVDHRLHMFIHNRLVVLMYYIFVFFQNPLLMLFYKFFFMMLFYNRSFKNFFNLLFLFMSLNSSLCSMCSYFRSFLICHNLRKCLISGLNYWLPLNLCALYCFSCMSMGHCGFSYKSLLFC